jgi:hypothetical protein
MNGKYPMICEFIGKPWIDRPVYYWARWNGIKVLNKYTGQGHDHWSHISWYRSKVNQRANLWIVEDEMPITASEIDKIADEVYARFASVAASGQWAVDKAGYSEGYKFDPKSSLRQSEATGTITWELLTEVKEKIDQLNLPDMPSKAEALAALREGAYTAVKEALAT